MPDFSIDVEDVTDDVKCVNVEGFLDAHTFEQMEETIEGLFGNSVYQIIVNLEKVEYISSAGCGVFIGAIGEAQDNSGDIVLLRPTPNVMEVFELLGLTQIFTFCASLEEAQDFFKK